MHMQTQETTSGHLPTVTFVDYVLCAGLWLGIATSNPSNPLTEEGEEACSTNKGKVRF